MIRSVGLLYIALCAVVILFHAALILGVSWGHLTMGGRWEGALPFPARLLSLAQIVLLAWFAVLVGNRAGVFSTAYAPRWGISLVLAVSTLSVIANTATPSVAERVIWGPVSVAMLVCVIIVVLARRGGQSQAAK